MDLVTSIIGGAVVLACIIPFVMMGVNNRKREKRQQEVLFGLAERNHCRITRHDLWDNSLIGIDDNAKRLFFIGKASGEDASLQVDLAEVQQARIADTSRTVNSKEGDYKKTDRVELVLTYRERGRKESALEFYNAADGSMTLLGELRLAEKWSGIIREAIA